MSLNAVHIMNSIVNNGSRLANELHFLGYLKHDQTIDNIVGIVRKLTNNDVTCRFMEQDEDKSCFWEDFCDRADELGYKLKY